MPKRKRPTPVSSNRLNPVRTAVIERAVSALRLAAIPQSDIEAEQQILRKLPKALGYESVADFFWAFRAANGLRTRRILTPRKMKELIRRSQAGESPREVAAALGCAAQTVSNIRVKLGITRRYRARTKRR